MKDEFCGKNNKNQATAQTLALNPPDHSHTRKQTRTKQPESLFSAGNPSGSAGPSVLCLGERVVWSPFPHSL